LQSIHRKTKTLTKEQTSYAFKSELPQFDTLASLGLYFNIADISQEVIFQLI